MIVAVPIPALLVYEIVVILLGALPQTLVDGSGPSTGKQRCGRCPQLSLTFTPQFTESSPS